jgi:hypothetical protein
MPYWASSFFAAWSLPCSTVRREGKLGLRQFCGFTEANSALFNEGKLGLRQFCGFTEANSALFNEGKRQKWPNPNFPQQNSVEFDRLLSTRRLAAPPHPELL